MGLQDPGKKRRKITLLKRVLVNSSGDTTSTWTAFASVWADERPLRMDERFQSDALHSVRTSNFRIYYRADVGPEMQLQYAGLNWKITGLAEVGYKEELDITAEVVY